MDKKYEFKENIPVLMLHIILAALAANAYFFTRFNTKLIPVFVLCFIAGCLMPALLLRKIPGKMLKLCYFGTKMLVMFLVTTVISIIAFICGIFMLEEKNYWLMAGVPFLVELVYFWIGIICVYIGSKQLGMRYRVLGILVGMIPIAHLVVLGKIISVCDYEVKLECGKHNLDEARKDERICATKYPILMIHGVFFRDFEYFNYWGRIPEELEKNGATIYYGKHESANPVDKSGEAIAARIREIVNETGCGKVNIIAHSKGGLDTRSALCFNDCDSMVASITTINTPHRGCEFADYLLGKAPAGLKDKVAASYNAALRRLGDKTPDFIAAVTDLTASSLAKFNEKTSFYDPKARGIFAQSVGSTLWKPAGGRFPLNMSYLLVKAFDGKNDGLVGKGSFQWGEKFTYVESTTHRGVSHGDMIDLNRENIPGFDVREFYVGLVADLKARGL